MKLHAEKLSPPLTSGLVIIPCALRALARIGLSDLWLLTPQGVPALFFRTYWRKTSDREIYDFSSQIPGSSNPIFINHALRASNSESRPSLILYSSEPTKVKKVFKKIATRRIPRGILATLRKYTILSTIECEGGFDLAGAIPCPVGVGGAAIHHGRTLHCAGPNRTDGARFAYILAFQIPPVPLAGGRDFYWNCEKENANPLIRKNAWRKRGEIVIELLRRARYGDLGNPKGTLFKALRAMRALLHSK